MNGSGSRYLYGIVFLFLVVLIVPVAATAPAAGFSGIPRQGLSPLTVQFTDASTGTPTAWSWTFGDGGTSSVQNPSHTYNTPGTYTVTLTATNSDGSNSIDKSGYISVLTQGIIPSYNYANIHVSNDAGVKYDTNGSSMTYIPDTYGSAMVGGFNSLHITTDPTAMLGGYGGFYTTRNQSGTFWLSYTGGQATQKEGILMLAVNGTVPDDFSVHIRSSGYTWPLSDDGITCYDDYLSNAGSPGDATYVDGAVDETFTKKDFYYGPQIWRPTSQANYRIYYGQDMSDTTNTFQIMFIDLNAGALRDGTIKIDYSFTNLTTFAAFNVYGWYQRSNHGTGITATNGFDSSSVGPSSFAVLGIPAAPVADFTSTSGTADIASPVQFTDTSQNTPQSWYWEFGDGSTSTEQNPSHTYGAIGNYTVSLNVMNIKGSDKIVKTDCITKKVLKIPAPDFSASVTSGTSPLAVTFTNLTIPSDENGTVMTWYWDFGDGYTKTIAYPASPVVTHWYVPGTYSVNLTVANSDGSKSLVKTGYVTVASNGRANQIDNPGFDTGSLSPWSNVMGASVSSSPTHSGSYSIKLSGRNADIQQYVDLTNVTTMSFWAYSASTATIVCVNIDGSQVYYEQASSSVRNQWISFSFTLPSSYRGVHTVDILQYYSRSSPLVYIDDITAIPHPSASFTATPVNGRTPLTVQFTDTSTGSGITGYSWNFGDGNTSTQQNPSHTYTTAGTYTVTLTATNAGGSDTATQTGLVSAADFSGALPGYTGVYVHVANPEGTKWNANSNETYYINPTGGGLNAIHISAAPSNIYGQVTSSTDQTGTFYISDTSGSKYEDDIVLLLAVNGTLPDDFAAHIKTSGYTWTPSASAKGPAVGSYTYQEGAVDHTFTKNDFTYGPQSWKPTGSNTQYPLFYGEDMASSENQYLLMFIDTRVGALASTYSGSSLTNNGAVKVDYSFSYLPRNAVFNVYAWKNASSFGQGMGWTNNVDDPDAANGYIVHSSHPVTPVIPVSNFTASPTTGIAPFNVKFRDLSENTPTRWSWDFGDGGSSTARNPVHTYTTAGTYTVKLLAGNDAGGNLFTRSGYITVTASVPTTSSFNLAGVTTNSGTGTNQTVTVPVSNATVSGNVVNVTGVGSSWDHLSITMNTTPVSDGANVTGNVSGVVAVTAPVTVPLTSLSNSATTGPNVTLSLSLSEVPDAAASIVGTISSDPDTAHQSSFSVAATNANQQIVATAYTITYTKTGIANAGDGGSTGIIRSATITMAVSPAWVAANGGTGHIVIMHQTDSGTSALLTTTFTGTDSAGNDVFTAVSPTGLSIFTLVAVSPLSSGSSSGFSSDGGSNGGSFAPTSFVLTASAVGPGETMTFAVNEGLTDSRKYGLTSVALVPSQALDSTQLTVSDAGMSLSSSALEGRQVAGMFRIEPIGVNPSSVSSGTITFVLDGSWLTDHSLTPDNIVLLRDVNGQWTELPTTFVSQSGSTYTFSATTPGFSYFAIASKTGTGSASAAAAQTTAALQAAANPAVQTSTTPFLYTPRPTKTTPAVPAARQAAPTVVAASAPASGIGHFPIVVAVAAAAIVLIVVSVVLVRRWWIRRQNPALFRKYD